MMESKFEDQLPEKGEDEENSPECLLPAKDPYSSDDEQPQEKLKDCKKDTSSSIRVGKEFKHNKKNFILFNNMDSQDIRPEQSHYLFNINYQPMSDEISLENKSVEDCLIEIFQFIPNDSFNQESKTYRGKIIAEIIRKESFVSWLSENDSINWKTASDKKREAKQMLFNQISCDYNHSRQYFPQLCVAEAAMDVYYELMTKTHSFDRDEIRNERRNVLSTFMEKVGNCIDSSNYISNGKCEDGVVVYVPHHLVSDNSPLLPQGRKVTVTVKPDGVFTYRQVSRDGMYRRKHWLTVLEIQGHFAKDDIENLDSSSKLQTISSKSYKEKSSVGLTESSSPNKETKSNFQNPDRPLTIDKLLDPNYVSVTKKYISSSLPLPFRGMCYDRMAGIHVTHLLCLAKKYFDREHIKKTKLGVCGLFMINEYIYLTKLENIDYNYLNHLLYNETRERYSAADISFFTSEYKSLRRPFFSCSNWKLDVTVANHRLALLIFLSQYLQSTMKDANKYCETVEY